MQHSRSTITSFRDLLDPGALPVHGSTLRAEDFVLQDGQWCVIVPLAEHQLDVRLSGDPASMTCILDGEEYRFLHPYRKTLHHAGASAQEWFDHFCTLQADSMPGPERSWEGTSVQAMLTRAEHGITAYDQRERSGSELGGVQEAQAWLDANLADTQVSATVHPLGELPLRTDGTFSGQVLCRIRDDEIDGYLAVAVASDLPPAQFYEVPGYMHATSPHVHVHSSGRTMLGYRADMVLDAHSVLPHLGSETTADGCGEKPSGWLLIHISGTRCVLPFPAGASNLIVDVDGDGSQVSVRVASSRKRAQVLEAEDLFDRRWGEFLDDDRALEPATVEAGILRAESTLEHHLTQEQEGDARALTE